MSADERVYDNQRQLVRDLVEMRELRGRMERELGRETPGLSHVKFGRGGLVDVEFTTQALQLVHGGRHRAIRSPNTLAALSAVGAAGLLPAGDAPAFRVRKGARAGPGSRAVFPVAPMLRGGG